MPQYNKHMHILVCLKKTKKKKTNKHMHMLEIPTSQEKHVALLLQETP